MIEFKPECKDIKNHNIYYLFCHQVAALWAANVSAFIGPQETCVHEGRMAAAFNLPMISYVRIIIDKYFSLWI